MLVLILMIKSLKRYQSIFNSEINITVTEETKFKIIEDLKMALQNPSLDFPKLKRYHNC